MNILFLSTWFPYPPDNGSKLRVYHLLRSLGQRHRVTLVSFAFGEAQPNPQHLLDTCCQRIELVRRSPFDRGRLLRLLHFFSITPIANWPVPEMSELVHRVLAQDRIEVIISSTTGTAVYALLAGDLPKILEEHNSAGRMAHGRYQQQTSAGNRLRAWISWKKVRYYESLLYRRFQLCTMVSEEDRAATLEVIGRAPVRIEVIPNGVDCHYNRPALVQPKGDHLVFNGSLTYGANYDAMQWFLAKVYPRIKAQVPGVSLTITGSTKGVDMAGLALDDRVTLTGFVEDIRLPVAEANVCVAPIRQGGGTRLKILEAMALGTPVVATCKGAEGLAVTDGEHLLLADDSATFAHRVVELLRDQQQRQRLAANARRLVERRYDWQALAVRFVDLVETTARRTT